VAHVGSVVEVVDVDVLEEVDVLLLVVVGTIGAAFASASTSASIMASTTAASPVTTHPPLASIFANATPNLPVAFDTQVASTGAPRRAAFAWQASRPLSFLDIATSFAAAHFCAGVALIFAVALGANANTSSTDRTHDNHLILSTSK